LTIGPSVSGDRPTVPAAAVLVAAYNAEATIEQTLDSLLAQTSQDWQAVVVDDGSSDRTLEIARQYETVDERITVLTQANMGAAAARNRAARQTEAMWLLPLDADDYLDPRAIEHQLSFAAEHPGYDLYLWGQWLLFDGGAIRANRVYKDRGIRGYGLKDISFQRTHIGATLLWRAATFASLGGYRDVYAEDFDLALRAALAGHRALRNPERLQYYRVSAGSKTASGLDQHVDSVIALLAEAREMCTDVVSRCHHILRAAEHQFISSLARTQFRDRLLCGERDGLRRLYLDSLKREPSLGDRWLWAFPVAMLEPRLLRHLLR